MKGKLDGMKSLEESEESAAWREGRKRKAYFLFRHEHDVHLYHLKLEAAKWDEEKDDLVYDRRGNIVLEGGWQGIADGMAKEFGVEFTATQVRTRMALLEARGETDGPFFERLFEEAMGLGDRVKAERMRLLSVLQAKVSTDKVEDGLVKREVPEADRPAGD